jgi:hypothetical protein
MPPKSTSFCLFVVVPAKRVVGSMPVSELHYEGSTRTRKHRARWGGFPATALESA